MSAKFQIYKSPANSQFYYHLCSPNNEIILKGEGYISKQSCYNGIESVRINAPLDSRYERKKGINTYSFNLKAANGEIIGTSETYNTEAARDNGIEAVKRDAPNASIQDLT